MGLQFEISSVNYASDQNAIQDGLELLQAGIADAGYVVRHSVDRFFADRTHILIDRLQPELLDFLMSQRLRYGLVVSEEVTPDGAFGWSPIENGGDPYGVGRAYAVQIERAAFVWCTLEKSLAFCRKHNARVGLIPFGFSPRFLPRYPIDWAWRDIPGLITGPLTERRAAVQRGCAAHGFPLQHAGHPLPGWLRNSYLSRAHLHVAPSRTDAHTTYVNPQRLIQSVCYKVGLVLEIEPGASEDFAGFYDPAAPGKLAERTIELYSDLGALRRTVDLRFERFADTRAMAKPFADLIAATVEG